MPPEHPQHYPETRRGAGLRFRVFAVGLCMLLLPACFGTPVEFYLPKSDDEAAICDVLVRYVAAKRRFNVAGLLACLHPDGRYHFAGQREMTKASLAGWLGDFWQRLKAGDPGVMTIAREDLNGDFFLTGRYVNPVIEVNGDRARVRLTFTKGWWGSFHTVFLVRENRRWIINRLEWPRN